MVLQIDQAVIIDPQQNGALIDCACGNRHVLWIDLPKFACINPALDDRHKHVQVGLEILLQCFLHGFVAEGERQELIGNRQEAQHSLVIADCLIGELKNCVCRAQFIVISSVQLFENALKNPLEDGDNECILAWKI
jgi:hypothetical protein